MRKKQWILLLVVLAAFVAATAGMRGYQNNQMMLPESLTKKMVSGWHLQKMMIPGAVRRIPRHP